MTYKVFFNQLFDDCLMIVPVSSVCSNTMMMIMTSLSTCHYDYYYFSSYFFFWHLFPKSKLKLWKRQDKGKELSV